MIRAYKYRLYPNAAQTRELETMIETHRRIYNLCLMQREEAAQKIAWGERARYLTFKEQRDWYTSTWRDNKYYSRLNSNSAHETIKRLDLAFQAFFRRLKEGAEDPGYPTYRPRGAFRTVKFGTYPNGLKLLDEESRIRIQHVGDVKVKLHRPVGGKIKVASVSCEAGKWFVVLTCDVPANPVVPKSTAAVGIDVGLSSFVATSDGEHVKNPRYLKTSLPELRRAQRALSRKKKGGSNRCKARQALSRLHARVANQRRDHHHKVAHDLVHRYGFIAVENLNVLGLIEKSGSKRGAQRLTRSIQDAAWGSFLNTLESKAEQVGGECVRVEPRGTSQECSGCGKTVTKTLWERTHRCPRCGLVLDRDVNAARNILARGRQARPGPAGANVVRKDERSPRSAVRSSKPGIRQAPTAKVRGSGNNSPRSLKEPA